MSEILFVTRKYPPSVGGMEKLSYELSTRMAGTLGVSIIAWGYSQSYLPFFFAFAFFRASVELLRRPARVLYIGDPVLSPLGLALRALFRLPTVVTVHGLDIAFPNALYQWVVPRCLRKLDLLVCISTHTRDLCIERGIPPERCHVIRPGVEIDRAPTLSKDDAKMHLGSLTNRCLLESRIVLSVGRLVPRKGVLYFVVNVFPSVVRACPNVHYLVIGEGPQRQEIERAVQRLGLEDYVSLIGSVDDATLKTTYQASDLLVMPNIAVRRDPEGFGLVALEASAAGLWVVASKVDGIPDAVREGKNGFLIEPGDTETYVKVISSLLADERSVDRLGERAREYVRRAYSWDDVIADYRRTLEQLISTHGGDT